MIQRYPVERTKIRWQRVANDQWHAQVIGVATGAGEFKFPSSGVYVIVGKERTQKFAEDWARNKGILSLDLEA